MLVLSVDPGINGCGCALWKDRLLVAAAYVSNTAVKSRVKWEMLDADGKAAKTGRTEKFLFSGPTLAASMAQAVRAWAVSKGGFDQFCVVVEWPQTYGGKSAKGDTNDLFLLAAVDGAICALLGPTHYHFRPHDWKGGAQKPSSVNGPYPIIAMIEKRLSDVERKAVELPRNRRHAWDVWDGIGVGLKFLDRFERIRVYARE